jgi:protocatechuate 4,5-dioxygenase alpha chain
MISNDNKYIRENAMAAQRDKSRTIPGTTVFDGAESRKGYRINKFAMSFTKPENRTAFTADEEAYMESWSLSDPERQFLRDRDYRGLIEECGGNIYMIMKLGTCTGHGLYHVGAQLRGQTFEEFMATRTASGAR